MNLIELMETDIKAKRTVKRTVKDISKQRAKRYNLPKNINSEKFEKFVKIFLKQMMITMRSKSTTILMLTGKPGTSKTSSIIQLSKLLGMNLFILEASQITSDQFTNIPYIVYNPKKNKKSEITMNFEKDDTNEFKLINAESAIITQMKKIRLMDDAEHMKIISKNKQLQDLYDKFKSIIQMVRKKSKTDKKGFSGILLLDEYFRTEHQNILRQILNKQIGTDDVPEDIFIVAASNIEDRTSDSLQQINLNQQFAIADFDNDYSQGPDGFFGYIADNYTDALDDTAGAETENKNEEKIIISPDVYNAFKDNITEEDFNNDSESGRVSPRRLEQMMLYINSRVPVKSEKEAAALLKYVKLSCRNYLTGDVYPIYNKLKKITIDIISQTTPGMTIPDELDDTNWGLVFENELDARLELGNKLSYPITLTSMPGMGKTTTIHDTAIKKNMGLILIDCSTLNPEDTVGLPLPDTSGDTIKTKFTEPPLYKRIMNSYRKEIQKLKDKNVDTENRKYNVILDLGEINRVESVDIFNKLRLLLLDKKVGSADFKLPEDILIISDLNPQDVNVQELPEHFLDVLDFIPVELSIKDEENYLLNMDGYEDEISYLKFDVKKLSLNILRSIYDRLKSDIDINGNDIKSLNAQPYYWNIDGVNIIYVSPREITFMFQSIIDGIYTDFLLNDWPNADLSDKKTRNFFISEAQESTYTALKDMIKGIGIKQQVEIPDINKFLKIVYEIIKAYDFEGVIVKEENDIFNSISFSSFLADANYNVKEIINNGGSTYLKQYLSNVGDVNELKNDIGTLFVHMRKNMSYDKMAITFGDIIDLFNSIDYSDIPSGNAIKDSIRMFFKEQYKSLMDDEDFLITLADLPDNFIDKFTEKLENF